MTFKIQQKEPDKTNSKQKLIKGAPGRSLFFFALPMILGNLFQQFYNMADSVIVGRCVGQNALAAVGASYSFTNVFNMIAYRKSTRLNSSHTKI